MKSLQYGSIATVSAFVGICCQVAGLIEPDNTTYIEAAVIAWIVAAIFKNKEVGVIKKELSNKAAEMQKIQKQLTALQAKLNEKNQGR